MNDGFSFDWRIVLLLEATDWERTPLAEERIRDAAARARLINPEHSEKINAAERDLLDPDSDIYPLVEALTGRNR